MFVKHIYIIITDWFLVVEVSLRRLITVTSH